MKFQKTILYVSLKSYIPSVTFLVILYLVEILCQTLRFKTTRNYDNLPKKKGGHLPSKINGQYFSNHTKNAMVERESHAEKNIALRAACLITPSDFMIPGTICKDVSAREAEVDY